MLAKKRRRTPFSCTVCRKRKVKCDRLRPVCGNCEKSKCPESCSYESPPAWESDSGMMTVEKAPGPAYIHATTVPIGFIKTQREPASKYILSELERLKQRQIELEQALRRASPELTEKITLLDKKSEILVFMSKDGRCLNFGINTWNAIAHKDPFVQHLVDDFEVMKKKKKMNDLIAGRRPFRTVNGPASDILERQIKLKKQVLTYDLNKANIDAKDLSGITMGMLKRLPPHGHVQGHLAHFFRYLVPFFPVFDERDFCKAIARILTYTEDGIPQLNFLKKTDPILICTLMIMMRMSFLNVLLKSEVCPQLPHEELMLLSHPIEADVVNVAHATLQHFNFLRKSSIEVVQLLILLKHYYKHAPEDGDGGEGVDSLVFNGTLVNSATTVGVHRELAERPGSLTIDETQDYRRFISLWRKTWWMIVVLDIGQSLTFGALPRVNEEESDAKRPEYDPAFANLVDPRLEHESIRRLLKRIEFHPTLRRIMKLTMSLQTCPTVRELMLEIGLLDRYTSTKINPELPIVGNEFLASEERIVFIELGCFILGLEHYLLLHHETRGDTSNSFVMASKILKRSLDVLKVAMEMYRLLMSELSNYRFALLSLSITHMTKVSQFFFFALVRIRLIEQKVKLNEVRVDHAKQALLVDLSKKLYAKLKDISSIFFFLSHQYYSALKKHAEITFMLDCLKGGDYVIKEDTRAAHKNCFESLSVPQLASLLEMIDQVQIDEPKRFALRTYGPPQDDSPVLPPLKFKDDNVEIPHEESWNPDISGIDPFDFFIEDFKIPKFV